MRTRAASKLALDPASLASVLAGFIQHLRVRGYSSALEKQARLVLPRFFGFLQQQRVHDIRNVTEEHVFAYARTLQQHRTKQGQPLTAYTLRSYLGVLQRLFRLLMKQGVILHDPTLDLDLPKVSKLPRVVLSEAQARRLMEAASPYTPVGKRNRALLETLYGAGLRRAECAGLQLRDLDLAQGTLFVRLGKGKKDRVVPFAGEAKAALDRYLEEGRPALLKDTREQALFLANQGGPLSTAAIEAIVRSTARAAGLKPRVSPHVLRHTYATHLVRGGADIRHVQALLGHKALSSTAIYTRVFPKDLQDTLAKAHPRERAWKRRNAGKHRATKRR